MRDMEDEQTNLRRVHYTQLVGVRKERDDLRLQVEKLREGHTVELNIVKEQGRKEGRESAAKEDDALKSLLEEHNVNYSGRKVSQEISFGFSASQLTFTTVSRTQNDLQKLERYPT